MYTSLNRPAANNKLHFAGEALSIRHACVDLLKSLGGSLTSWFQIRWVVGALDSAWRAVYNYLFLSDPSKIAKFFELWGTNAEWFEEPETFVPHDPVARRQHSVLEKYIRRTHGVRLA